MKIIVIESRTEGTRHAEVSSVEAMPGGSLRYTMTGRDSAKPHVISLPPYRLTLKGAQDDATEFLATGGVPFRYSDMGVK